MLDEEGALADLPQRNAAIERGQELGLRAAEAQRVAGPIELIGGLSVHHSGFGVGEEAFRQRAFSRQRPSSWRRGTEAHRDAPSAAADVVSARFEPGDPLGDQAASDIEQT